MALRMERRGSHLYFSRVSLRSTHLDLGSDREFRTVGDMRDGRLTTVLYINKRGRLVVPPNIPYTPVEFWVRPDMNARKRQSLWLELAKTLAREMKTLGVSGFLPLCPEDLGCSPLAMARVRCAVPVHLRSHVPERSRRAPG